VVVEVTGPPWGPTGTDVGVEIVPPGRLDVVSDERVGAEVVDTLGGDVVEPWPVTGVVSIVVDDAVVGVTVVVDVEHSIWVVVVPPGSDVVEPWPLTGVVPVVVLDPDVVVGAVVVAAVVVAAAVVDVEHTVVVVGATVVVAAGAVVVVASVVAAATVVLDAGVDVGAVVGAEVGTAVVGGGCVEGGAEVLGAWVVDAVEGVLVVHCESSATDVLCVLEKLSGHTAWTVNVIVPLTPPGTSVVANVVAFCATGFA
jgi:hypothetical protein